MFLEKRVAWLVAATFSSAAYGQGATCCDLGSFSAHLSGGSITWDLVLGDYVLSKAEGSGSVVGIAAVFSDNSTFAECELTDLKPGVVSEADGAFQPYQDLLMSPYHISLALDDLSVGNKYGSASADGHVAMTATSGSSSISSGTTSNNWVRLGWIGDPPRPYRGAYSSFGIGAARAKSKTEWELDRVPPGLDPWIFTGSVTLYSGWESIGNSSCDDSGPINGDPILVQVDFISIGVEATDEMEVVTTTGLHGVHAKFNDGSTVRLGFFTDEEFDETSSVPNTWEIDGELDVPTKSLPSEVTALKVFQTVDSFTTFDGNLNGDYDTYDRPFICWADWLEMVAAQDAELGDEMYNARADFNLDGEIDQADGAAMRLLPCVIDMNCDGVLDFGDELEYLNLYGSDDPLADLTLDGVIDFGDYLEFLNMYAIACPS